MDMSNSALQSYLDYYVGLDAAPQFAVLITGKWGSGKTWLVRNYVSQRAGLQPKFLYVSLNGIRSFREIEAAFFAALHPNLASRGMGIAAKIIGGLGSVALEKYLDVSADSTHASDFLKTIATNTEGYVLIFDDLERCSMPLADMLGYINNFIEHGEYKAILISNEDELRECIVDGPKAGYPAIKEKLVGKTFRVVPDLKSATDAFVGSIASARCREFLAGNVDVVSEAYSSSGFENLRIIRNALLDFARVYDSLSSRFVEHGELMRAVLAQYLAYAFEIHIGNLKPGDIAKLKTEYFMSFVSQHALAERPEQEQEDVRPCIVKKYAAASLESPIVAEEAWTWFFEYGHVDIGVIERSLASSNYFFDENTPEWQKLLDLWSLSDAEFSVLHASVKAAWDRREWTEVATVVQVAGLLMFLSGRGLVGYVVEDVLESGRIYVDSLARNGDLVKGVGGPRQWPRDDGLADAGDWGTNIPQFGELVEYLRQRTDEAILESMPDAANVLLGELRSDVRLFCARLVLDNSAENVYCRTPILAYIEASDFVDAVTSVPRLAWRRIGAAFRERYAHEMLAKHLVNELSWLEAVIAMIEERIAAGGPTLDSIRLRSLVDESLIPGRDALKRYQGIPEHGQRELE